MVNHMNSDQTLLHMPSLRAVRSFVAAAKYQNFTRAAESLCVTQAAISRQIRELESSLGVPLFRRTGRSVELTEAGVIFYDAAHLSFVNIAQAAQRIQKNDQNKQELTICCSPAFSALWLTPRLPSFFSANPHIHINVLTTHNFLHMEPGVRPDIFINKHCESRKGYHSIPLFYDLIFPVCSPQYIADHPEVVTLEGLSEATLLDLSAYGRSQIAEHVDWGVWFNHQGMDFNQINSRNLFNSNEYSMLIQMALNHQGVSLGWSQLVTPLIEQGSLIRIGNAEALYREKLHYLTYADSKQDDEVFTSFKLWFLNAINQELTRVTSLAIKA